jgi:hypothetical protein
MSWVKYRSVFFLTLVVASRAAVTSPAALEAGGTFTVRHDEAALRAPPRYDGDAIHKVDANDGRAGIELDLPARRVAARFGDHFVVYVPPGDARNIDLTGRPGHYRLVALVLQTDETIDLGHSEGGAMVELALPNGLSAETVVKVEKIPR